MKTSQFGILLLVAVFAISCGNKTSTTVAIFQSALEAARSEELPAFKSFFTKNAVRTMENLPLDTQKNVFIGTWKRKYGESGGFPETRNESEFLKDAIMTLEVKNSYGDWDKIVFF